MGKYSNPGARGFNAPKNIENRAMRNHLIITDLVRRIPVAEVAEKYGLSVHAIYAIKKKALTELAAKSATDLKQEIMLELEEAKKELYDGAEYGDYKKIETALSIIEKQAKIEGLYSSEKQLADAAMLAAQAQAIQAQEVLVVIQQVLNGLDLSYEQESKVPSLLKEAVHALESKKETKGEIE